MSVKPGLMGTEPPVVFKNSIMPAVLAVFAVANSAFAVAVIFQCTTFMQLAGRGVPALVIAAEISLAFLTLERLIRYNLVVTELLGSEQSY